MSWNKQKRRAQDDFANSSVKRVSTPRNSSTIHNISAQGDVTKTVNIRNPTILPKYYIPLAPPNLEEASDISETEDAFEPAQTPAPTIDTLTEDSARTQVCLNLLLYYRPFTVIVIGRRVQLSKNFSSMRASCKMRSLECTQTLL
jgi:hypothetical protein